MTDLEWGGGGGPWGGDQPYVFGGFSLIRCVASDLEGTVYLLGCRSSPGSTASGEMYIDLGTGLSVPGSRRKSLRKSAPHAFLDS